MQQNPLLYMCDSACMWRIVENVNSFSSYMKYFMQISFHQSPNRISSMKKYSLAY